MEEDDNSSEKLYENLYGQDDDFTQIEETRLTEYNKTLEYKVLTHNYVKNDPNYGEAQFEVINNSLSLYSGLRK